MAVKTLHQEGEKVKFSKTLLKFRVYYVFLFAMLCVLAGQPALSATQHSTPITTPETWYAAGNPHEILIDIPITATGILTIEEGVEIYFTGRYYLQVDGELHAVGTQNDKILFTAYDTDEGWAGIRFETNTAPGGNDIIHCILEYAKKDTNQDCTTSPDYCGGAVYISNCSNVNITDSEFRFNGASRGGAIYCFAYSAPCNPLIDNNYIHENVATRGGGICCRAVDPPINPVSPIIMYNTIHNNEAWCRGGGLFIDKCATPSVINNEISYNTISGRDCLNCSLYGGAGIFCCFKANAIIEDNYIHHNDATNLTVSNSGNGGGIYCNNWSCPQIINGNDIKWNVAENGGGIYCILNSSPTISNCGILYNTAEMSGGGMYCDQSSPTMDESTIHGNEAVAGSGGGVYCTGSSPQFGLNSIIVWNKANSGNGGGICCIAESDVQVTYSQICSNTAKYFGGGVYSLISSPQINNTRIEFNEADQGGGIFHDTDGSGGSPIIHTNWISNNKALDGSGGGLVCMVSTANILWNKIRNNECTHDGGGIWFGNPQPGAFINLNIISGNKADYDGGGIYTTTSPYILYIMNNLIVENEGRLGGGICLETDASPKLVNNTISRNTALSNGGGIYYGTAASWPEQQVTIFALNTPDEMNNLQGTYDYCYIGTSPGFVNASGGNYRLTSSSPCRDASPWVGTPGTACDLDGNPRVNNSVDAGAYEYWGLKLINIPADFPGIQDGIDGADDHDIIVVDSGTYNETLNFNGKNIVVESSMGPEYTVINGGQIGSAVVFENGENYTAVLRGFTIINGSTDFGGGIRCVNSSPTLENLILHNNIADVSGGGISCESSSFPELHFCTFYDNMADTDGGAVYAESSSPSFSNCTFSDNSAFGYGGGMALYNSSPMIQTSIIAFCPNGEGVYCQNSNPVFSCSNVCENEGGNWTGEISEQALLNGNMSQNPVFCDRTNRDYSIDSLSPCAPDHYLNECGELIGSHGVACTSICGDANRDGTVNVSDAVHIINYVFVGGDPPLPMEAGDCNCDTVVNVSDAVWLINYVFVGGNAPCDTDGDSLPDC